MKSTIGGLNRGLMARVLLATIGGLASLVAGFNGHYHADKSTPKKKKGKSRGRWDGGTYGASLIAHFNRKGVCYSKKRSKLRKAYGHQYC